MVTHGKKHDIKSHKKMHDRILGGNVYEKSLTVHGHFIDLCGVVLFNISENPDVVILHEVDGHTLYNI